MDDTLRFHWLVLAHLPRLAPATLRRLLALSADPREILDLPDTVWRSNGAVPETLSARRRWARLGFRDAVSRQADGARRTLERESAWLLPLGGPGYPALLAQIHDPPPLLYVAGSADALATRQLAIVGSRRCSPASARTAAQFAGQLVQAGFSVCSGLARGIDGAAHRGALDAGGPTVAVIATGIETCYPRSHRRLRSEILERGALVTEFRPATPPRPEHFPRRNRLISGLSVGVLVAEAGLQSGSLITARLALEQNRDVFAFPHSLQDPGGRGCHRLLREGAVLTESIEDVLAEVASLSAAHAAGLAGVPEPPGPLLPVWSKLGFDPVSVDELVAFGAGCPGPVLGALLELEVGGFVEQRGGLYCRKL